MIGPFLIALLLGAAAPEEAPRTPYLDRRAEPMEYPGPGRDDPAPGGLTEVRIGWFGPSDPADPERGDFWAGALLAVEEINKEGGVSGLPVRLVPGWSESPWAGGVNRLVRMVYEDHVWAILGSIDGAATHLAEQVVAKALVPLVSPGSTDKTVSFAGVPWMFTLLPGDDVQAAALAGWTSRQPEARPVTLISATDHDSRAAAAEFRAAFSRAGIPFAADLQCAPDAADAAGVADQIVPRGGLTSASAPGAGSAAGPSASRPPGAVVVLASPRASGRIASALRAAGYLGAILGGSNLARRAFLETAGTAAEEAVFPLIHDPADPRWTRFARDFAQRHSREPDFAAGAAYDALRLLVEAARRAGLNRARILDTLRALSPWPGVTGEVRFDNLGRNLRPVRLGTIREGKVVALDSPLPTPSARSKASADAVHLFTPHTAAPPIPGAPSSAPSAAFSPHPEQTLTRGLPA